MLLRRNSAIGLLSGSSDFSSFQGTATRYLPFSYFKESFTLFKVSRSSSVSTNLQVRFVPDFSISQNLLGLLSISQQISPPSLHTGSFVNKARMTRVRVLRTASDQVSTTHGCCNAHSRLRFRQEHQCNST